MFWIALHCPLLSLETFRATLGPADAARPVALLAAHRLTAVDRLGAGLGLEPGMRRATALALAPELLPGEVDPARDAAALTALAHVALAFTPMVAVEPPATVLLEVRASLRCFGGGARLLQRLLVAAEPLGHRLQVASAPTPLGASLLARWRGDFGAFMLAAGDRVAALHAALAEAPVALLAEAATHAEALQAIGATSLADLRALPREGLSRRFGAGLLDEIDRAFGLRPDPREPLLPPEVFASRLELFARADTSAQVLHGAGVLLVRLIAWAQARQVRVAAFTLRMRHEPRHRGDAAEASSLRLELAEPALDIEHLQTLLRERLARFELAAPTLELELECRETVHAPAPNAELFPTRQSEAQGLVRLLERLRARLGDEQVLRLDPRADHRPESATRLRPVAATLASASRRRRCDEPRPSPRAQALATGPSRRSGRLAGAQDKKTPHRTARPAADPGAADVLRDLVAGTGGAGAMRELAAASQPAPGEGAAGPQAANPDVAAYIAALLARSAATAAQPLPSRDAVPLPPAASAGRSVRVLPGQPAGPIVAPATALLPGGHRALRRPVWLLASPQPLAERGGRPSWQGRALSLLSGPERIESGWWDGGLALRDYFVAQAADGALVWIYRSRCPLDDEAADGWFLHGWFG